MDVAKIAHLGHEVGPSKAAKALGLALKLAVLRGAGCISAPQRSFLKKGQSQRTLQLLKNCVVGLRSRFVSG